MELINLLEIKSPYGYRQFKLVKGDIGLLSFPVDLLCVSAFRGSYIPSPGTVLGSLHQNRNIDLEELSENPVLDLRHSENTFMVNITGDPFLKKILCVEMIGTYRRSIEDILDSLLVTLYLAELKGIKVRSLMMPLLGTGLQQIEPGKLLGSLLKKVEYLLKTSVTVEEVFLVAYTNEQADLLNSTMNLLLKRSVSIFHKNQIISTVGGNIKEIITKNQLRLQAGCYIDLLAVLDDREINSFKLAITSRKICEHILNNMIKDGAHLDLAKKINYLRLQDVPPWMINYFHMLRIFGNAYAHDMSGTSKVSGEMNEQDIVIALFGLERVIEFYLSHAES